MTALNWVSLILGFFLLVGVLSWLTSEVSARRKHREKVELIKLNQPVIKVEEEEL